MGDSVIDPIPDRDGPERSEGDRSADRQEWVRANFTQIFGTSAENLQAQGINPRQYARDHRDQIRQFAQTQRRQGLRVPTGRGRSNPPSGITGPNATEPSGGGPANGGYGYGHRRSGFGLRGGTASVGILVALLALRFLLVDSFVGPHAAILWVLEIGGIVLVARVLLLRWLRTRRSKRRQSGRNGPFGF